MQTVQQANWYHRGDRDQRASVLIEKSHSLFVHCRERTQSHREVLKVVVLSWSIPSNRNEKVTFVST